MRNHDGCSDHDHIDSRRAKVLVHRAGQNRNALTRRSTAAISADVVHGRPEAWEGHGMAKEMEGDNRKRRALARAAREQGHRASEAGVTLGSSKQRRHAEHAERAEQDGPPPEGANKPGPRAPRPQEPPEPDPTWPRRPPPTGDTAPDAGALRLRYRELVTSAAEQAGVDFDTAREAGRATVSVLARMLDEADRRRLLDVVPAELTEGQDVSTPIPRRDAIGFVREVGGLLRCPPEQCRMRAQAVLGAIAAQDRDVLGALHLPDGLAELTRPPRPGGGLVGPDGHTAGLDEEELRAALRRLPDWTGDSQALTRTLVLPADQLERVLRRLDRLKQELGRGPRISRPDERTARFVVRTTNAGAVTALDVDLALRVDQAITQANAGLA
jgi:pterin-4a-carbinolamine dehydratase